MLHNAQCVPQGTLLPQRLQVLDQADGLVPDPQILAGDLQFLQSHDITGQDGRAQIVGGCSGRQVLQLLFDSGGLAFVLSAQAGLVESQLATVVGEVFQIEIEVLGVNALRRRRFRPTSHLRPAP